MYRKQMHFIRQPFQDGVDTVFFFPGGTCKEIVDEMSRSLAQGVPLITLTGVEGSGKTMICRMVEENLLPDLLPLFLSPTQGSLDDMLSVISERNGGDETDNDDKMDADALLDDIVMPRTLESFDDIVNIIYEQIVGEKIGYDEGTDTESLLDDIVNSLKARGQRLLIVFDEAEKIYLAPLERLRRMLDQVNEESLIIHLLFSGRPLLTENFEQLGIVTFKEIEERHFVLQPLDNEAVLTYLNNCMRLATGDEDDFFSSEVVDRIFSVAKGNFKKINHLALDYLKAEKLDNSFLTLLDKHQEIEIDQEEDRPRRSRVSSGMPKVDLDFLKLPSFRPQWLLYGGGTCAIVLLVLLLMGRSKDDTESEPVLSDVPVLELKNVEPLDSTAVTSLPDQPDVPTGLTQPEAAVAEPSVLLAEATESPPANVSVTESEKAPEIEVELVEAARETKITEADLPPVDKPVSSQAAAVETQKEPPAASSLAIVELSREPEPKDSQEKEDSARQEDTAKKEVTPLTTAQENKTEKLTGQSKIVVKPLRQKKEPQQPGEVTILEGSNKKIRVSDEKIDLSVKPDRAVRDMDADEIYQERLAAGTRWLDENNKDAYTVQLMVLASAQAEENLKQMLESEDYRAVAANLFILRQLGTPPTVKLFYGEYATLGAARKARNTLPVFLRVHQPFAVPVSDAVAGTRP